MTRVLSVLPEAYGTTKAHHMPQVYKVYAATRSCGVVCGYARVVYSRRAPYGPQCVSCIHGLGITADLHLWDVAYV